MFFILLKESPSPRANGDHAVDSRDSIGLNGNDKPGGSSSKPSAERPPSRSGSSSSRSTPSLKTKDVSNVQFRFTLHDFKSFAYISLICIFSWKSRELQAQKVDRQHRMQAAHQLDQKVPFHPCLLAIHHRINDYQIHIDRHPISMAVPSIHMAMFAQMVCRSQHHIQPVENRKYLIKAHDDKQMPTLFSFNLLVKIINQFLIFPERIRFI